MLPKKWVSIAMIGTEKMDAQEISADPDLNDVLSKLSDLSLEGKLLLTVAGRQLQERSGYLPMINNDTQFPDPSSNNEQPTCNRHAMSFLHVMLDGQFDTVLPEWFREVSARKLLTSSESIPSLLKLGKNHPELQKEIALVIGDRGSWLAQARKNRDWKWIQSNDPLSTWKNGDPQSRSEALKLLRKQDPDEARKMLVEVWKSEKADIRAKLVVALATGLSMEDEPFLESCLDDRSQLVRDEIPKLLGVLTESRFHKRMLERANKIFLIGDGKLSLVGTSRKLWSDDMNRDGLNNNQQLFQSIIQFVPPTYWCEKWEVSSKQLIKLAKLMFSVNPSRFVVVDWLCTAACYFHDEEFLSELLYEIDNLDASIGSLCVQNLSFEKREDVILKLLSDDPILRPHHPVMYLLLEHNDQRWTDRLTRSVFKSIHQYLNGNNAVRINNSHYQQSILSFAHHVPPEMKDEVIKAVEVRTTAKTWQDMLRDVEAIISFRQRMINAIEKSLS